MTYSKDLKKVIRIERKAKKLNESMVGRVDDSVRFNRLNEEYLEAVSKLRGLLDEPNISDEWKEYCKEIGREDLFNELIDII